jgi:hypothetical protein
VRLTYTQVAAVSRTLHIYLTMLAFVLMMFFAVTGVILNHEDQFGVGDAKPVEVTGTVPVAFLREPDRLMVVERLRSAFRATGAVSTFDADSQTVRVELRGPGRHTAAEIDRATGKATVTIERKGVLMRLDDLHRGKDSGAAWSWVLDASAALLFLGSLTGILMWFALPRRRKLGVAALVASLVICAAIYLAFVP